MTRNLPKLVRDLLIKYELPHNLQGFDAQLLYDAMRTDKKWHLKGAIFVLLEKVGQPVIVEDVPRNDVIQVLKELTCAPKRTSVF